MRTRRKHGRTLISPESIYRFIYHRSAQKDYWHRMLPRARHKRGRHARSGGSMVDIIKHRRPLRERPPEADNRQSPGHWEADFMLFAQYGQSILVTHERASRFTIIHRPQDRKAARTASHLADMLNELPPAPRRTIAFDNVLCREAAAGKCHRTPATHAAAKNKPPGHQSDRDSRRR